MADSSGKYSLEIVDPQGQLLADLGGRASNRRLVKSRNQADKISWSIDLDEFENYCRKLSVSPQNILSVGQNEIRVRRNGVPLSGGQIDYYNPIINPESKRIEVKATGFLSLFKDRYTGAKRTFTATEAATIAWTLIDESQSLTNGDFGVTQGSVATAGDHDRTYKRTNLKDALQAFGDLETGSIDHEFTYDKVFHTYASIGSDRPDIIFEYPGNIKSLSAPNDGTSIANKIIALGAGFGEEASTIVTKENLNSQISYFLREKKIIANGTDDSDNGVTDAANSELLSYAFPFEIPTLVIDGNVDPFITSYGIGDRIRVRINGSDLLNHINGSYRLERYELDIDEDDNEEVRLYLS